MSVEGLLSMGPSPSSFYMNSYLSMLKKNHIPLYSDNQRDMYQSVVFSAN